MTGEEGAAPVGAVRRDRAAALVAARQFGVITFEQLRACGLSRHQVEQRVMAAQLERLWRGVYTFGHRELTREGHLIAAVFACGAGAFLSHRAAAAHWELLQSSVVDVTVASRGGRTKRRGIRVHCVRRLDPRDVTEHEGIPITTVARTLVDLNAVVQDRLVERAYEQAQIRRLLPPSALEDALERAKGRKTRALRHLIASERRTTTVTRSELEERFLALIRRGGLPEPEVNARVAGYEVDGFAYHSTRQASTRDRRKDDDLEAAGYRVTRFTADQILRDPEDTLARATRAVLGAQ